MEPAQAAEASANVRGGKAEARSPSGYVGEVELQAHRAETRERIVAIRDLMARYADLNLRRVSWCRELEGRLPNDEADRESLTRLDAAKKRLLGLSASRRDAEHKLVEGKKDLARLRSDLVSKKARVLRAMEAVETNRVRLAESRDAMYATTFNRLSITQQNLTFRRWELAQGVAHIFSLSTIDALRSPPTSPARGQGDPMGGTSPGGYGSPGHLARQRQISICGLELDSSVIRKNKDAMLDNREAGNSSEKLATALGYAAHILQLLAAYFDIPLRYPVFANNSRSYICDLVPSKPEGRDRKGGRDAGGTAQRGPPPPPEKVKFPLYIDHVGVERERTRFAYAIFLLNKDIEQILNAHGLDAFGVAPHYTLSNLHKLLSYCN